MDAIPYDGPPEEEEWDGLEDETLPGRPRRQVLTWWSAGLFALILCAVGFYAGVRVEKGQLSNSGSTSAFPAAPTGARAAARTGAGLRGVFGAPGAGAGGGTFGTVSSISRNSLFVTDTSGNTIKVTLSSATKVTKNVGVGKKAVRPGDLVVVSGAKGTNGTVSATTVSDTGASPAAGGSARSSSSSGSSAVNQLFGGG